MTGAWDAGLGGHVYADCYCRNCKRSFSHYGIATHRMGHLNRLESVTVEMADGVWTYTPLPKHYERAVKRGLITQAEADRLMKETDQ